MRLAIVIGCNAYDAEALTLLNSAEMDAERIFAALIAPDRGGYDAAASALLLSPDLSTVMHSLHHALATHEDIEALTFFFAGHGVVTAGSFYMCVKNTLPGSYSTTALALLDIFRILAEKAPRQSNIIIDACESGGLIGDLSGLLKPENLGNAGTPEITLVATAAQDESAGETAKGGFGTNAILGCMSGHNFVQDSAPTLTLTEIGMHLSKGLPHQAAQTPVVWGLNLSGGAGFCRNPFFREDPTRPFREVIRGWSTAADAVVRRHHDDLYQVYADVSGDEWQARLSADRLAPVFSALSAEPATLIGFTERLTNALLSRAEGSGDVFRSAEAAAVVACCLLEHSGTQSGQELLGRVLERLGAASLIAGSALLDDLRLERRCLLPPRHGGLSEFFYLPLRIAKVLGWIAATSAAFPRDDPRADQAQHLFLALLKMVLENYAGSVVAISDQQAPGYAAALAAAIQGAHIDEAEELIGYLFHSLTEHHGQVASCNIQPERVLEFLIARGRNGQGMPADLIAKPTELTSVVLQAAIRLGLDAVFDDGLWKLDKHNLLAYFPTDYTHFGAETMQGGRNLLWQIGFDMFRLDDLRLSWPEETLSASPQVEAAATFASLIFPDRVAWHLLSDRPATN